MTRHLLLFLFIIAFLTCCKKSDETINPPFPDPPPTNQDCPDVNGVPNIPGWEHTEIAIPDNIYLSGKQPYFLNKDVGFLYGGQAGLWKTVDGGKTWEEVNELQNFIFTDLFFLDDKLHGFLAATPFGNASSMVLLKTNDGGLNWTEHNYSPQKIIRHIFFLDDQRGFAALASNGASSFSFAKTNDGGKTWTEFAGVVPINSQYINIHIFPGGFGYLAGTAGRIFKTVDAGQNWEVIHTGVSSLKQVQFFDEMNGFISDFSGILKTTDGGENWTRISQNYVGFFHFFSPTEGISLQTVGYNSYGDIAQSCGAFLLTDDGGETWTESEASSGFLFEKFFFLDNDTGFLSMEYIHPGVFVILERE